MLYERYPALVACKDEIENAVLALIDCYKNGGKLLLCGNGGSCADGDHIVGELMKGFLLKRTVGDTFTSRLQEIGAEDAKYISDHLQGSLPAISLSSQTALVSAFANDVSPDMVYAQMTYGYGKEGDVIIGLSTSGNSKNVVYAAKVAKAKKLVTIAMTGEKESELSRICDITIRVPESETYKIQELHLPVYHYICAKVEQHFFEEN